MKHKIVSHHQKDFDPKYNPHLKRTYHSKIKTGKSVAKMVMMGIMILIMAVIVIGAGGIWLYRDANEQAKQAVAEKVARNSKPKGVFYDQSSLNQKSNHKIDQEMVNHYAKQDRFINKINYDSKKDVAKIYLTKSSAKAVNLASNDKKANSQQLANAIKTGVKIDNTLSDQAVKVANHSHDGYFTFAFANAKTYQAPNTKTGNYKE